MKNIPLYKPYIPEDVIDFASQSLKSGWLGYGPKARELENIFTSKFGGYSVAVTSCTSALYLAARVLKRDDSDEVIIPAVTFVSTGMAFKQADYKVITADVDFQGLIDIASVKRSITPRTRAVVAVHLYGQKVQLKELREICDENKICLIEDCSHRLHQFGEIPEGDISCYSFNVMKELPSGEGGLIWGRLNEQENYAREYANVGLQGNTVQRTSTLRHSDYIFSESSGLKFLQNDIIASLTLRLIPFCENNILRRREIFTRYDKFLSRYKIFKLFNRKEDDSCLMYVMRMPAEIHDKFRDFLAGKGIATSHHYPSLAKHPLFSNVDECIETSIFEREIVTLPCYVELDELTQDYILSSIEEFVKSL